MKICSENNFSFKEKKNYITFLFCNKLFFGRSRCWKLSFIPPRNLLLHSFTTSNIIFFYMTAAKIGTIQINRTKAKQILTLSWKRVTQSTNKKQNKIDNDKLISFVASETRDLWSLMKLKNNSLRTCLYCICENYLEVTKQLTLWESCNSILSQNSI